MKRSLLLLLVTVTFNCTVLPVTGCTKKEMPENGIDCRKTDTPQARLICSDPALRDLNKSMVTVFNNACANLSAAGRTTMEDNQKNWQAYWIRSCSSDRYSVKFGPDAAACARTSFEERINHLKNAVQSGFDGKFRLYHVKEYQTVPTDGSNERFMVAVHSWSYPRIDTGGLSGTDLAYANRLNNLLKPTISPQGEMNASDSNSDYITSLEMVSSNILMLSVNSEFMGHMAAHPNAGRSKRYFVKPSLHQLTVSDVFNGDRWQELLSLLVYMALKRELGDSLDAQSPQALLPMVTDPAHWEFGSNGLTVFFNAYEVACYAVGPQSVTISWNALDSVLNDFIRSEFSGMRPDKGR